MVTENPAEGAATAGTAEAPKDAPEQTVPLARVEEMRKEWLSEAQSRFNPELDRHRNAAIKRAEAAEKKMQDLAERLAEAEERSSAYETAKDPEALRSALSKARRDLQAAEEVSARAERELAEVEETKAELRLQRKYKVDDEWIQARKKAGKTPLEILDEAASQFYLQQTGASATPAPKAEGAGMLANLRSSGSGEQVTKDNIDKLWLEGKLPGGDAAYRAFQQTGKI